MIGHVCDGLHKIKIHYLETEKIVIHNMIIF